jgi:hypothetical protein
VCVSVALVVQHVTHMTHVECLALPYFPTFSHKRHHFQEKKVLNKNACFDFLNNFFDEIVLIQTRIRRDVIIRVHGSSRKVLIVLFRF